MPSPASSGEDNSGPPGPYPLPPLDFARRALPILHFENPVWYRGHKVARDPLHFNRSTGRFASPNGEFGALYLGEDEFCSFFEAFSHEIRDDTFSGLIVSLQHLERCCLCPVSITGTVRLVDLTNGAALRALSPDADNRINDGPHVVSRQWAHAFWMHPEQPDGLFYRSRRAPERHAIALFDRIAPWPQPACDRNLLANPERLGSLLDYLNCALIP